MSCVRKRRVALLGRVPRAPLATSALPLVRTFVHLRARLQGLLAAQAQ